MNRVEICLLVCLSIRYVSLHALKPLMTKKLGLVSVDTVANCSANSNNVKQLLTGRVVLRNANTRDNRWRRAPVNSLTTIQEPSCIQSQSHVPCRASLQMTFYTEFAVFVTLYETLFTEGEGWKNVIKIDSRNTKTVQNSVFIRKKRLFVGTPDFERTITICRL